MDGETPPITAEWKSQARKPLFPRYTVLFTSVIYKY